MQFSVSLQPESAGGHKCRKLKELNFEQVVDFLYGYTEAIKEQGNKNERECKFDTEFPWRRKRKNKEMSNSIGPLGLKFPGVRDSYNQN